MTHNLIARSRALAGVLMALSLGACSTPQPLLDQANHGAALAMSLQVEMDNFRFTQSEISAQRLDSIRRQLTSLASHRVESDFDARVGRLAGTAGSEQLYIDLRTLADSRGADQRLLSQQLADLDAELAKVLAPLPDTAQALGTTQKALAVLGEELPMKDRLAAVGGFARMIRATIDDNRKKIEAAKQTTAVAPVQPPAPTAPARE